MLESAGWIPILTLQALRVDVLVPATSMAHKGTVKCAFDSRALLLKFSDIHICVPGNWLLLDRVAAFYEENAPCFEVGALGLGRGGGSSLRAGQLAAAGPPLSPPLPQTQALAPGSNKPKTMDRGTPRSQDWVLDMTKVDEMLLGSVAIGDMHAPPAPAPAAGAPSAGAAAGAAGAAAAAEEEAALHEAHVHAHGASQAVHQQQQGGAGGKAEGGGPNLLSWSGWKQAAKLKPGQMWKPGAGLKMMAEVRVGVEGGGEGQSWEAGKKRQASHRLPPPPPPPPPPTPPHPPIM